MTLYLQDADFTLYCGDALEELRTLPDGSVHCALTSPPFFGLRDYGTGSWEGGDAECEHAPVSGIQGRSESSQRANRTFTGSKPQGQMCSRCGARRVDQQIGLEATPDEWVARLVAVFRDVRRVLRDDGTFWLEVGDSYSAGGLGAGGTEKQASNAGANLPDAKRPPPGYKPKDLLGQPWLLAFALRADGWYLRQCIIWAKPNAMPESVRDRCTTAHSYVFLFSKRPRYFFDAEAIAEPAEWARWGDQTVPKYEGTDTASGWMQPKTKEQLSPIARRKPLVPEQTKQGVGTQGNGSSTFGQFPENGRKNARSVWQIPTSGFSEAHFATWPPALVERIIRAGTSERGVCPECRAPWVREVEREGTYAERKALGYDKPANMKPGEHGGGHHVIHPPGMTHDLDSKRVTVGWKPSCDHGHQPVPATVLDPFMGSGTTALVARKLGRRAVGIELNPDYCEMAARRVLKKESAPLPSDLREAPDGTLNLFAERG